MEKSYKTDRSRVRRLPKRGHYDAKTIHSILDSAFVCQVSFDFDGKPMQIPMAYGREGDTLYLHGSNKSRLMNVLANGAEVCIGVTLIDALVLARSLFHHSINYRSVVLFGQTYGIEKPEARNHALRIITDQMIPGRWDEARQPSPKELEITAILEFNIAEGAAKIRTGPPGDDKEDEDPQVWGGLLPFEQVIRPGIPDEITAEGLSVPPSVRDYKIQ